MADQRHVEILQQGTLEWNKWREVHPTIQPDLRDANLTNMFLPEMNLHGANLERARLAGSTLIHADLHAANLSYAVLSRTSMNGANLAHAMMDGAWLTGADLSQARLDGASLKHASLYEARFYFTQCEQTDVSYAHLGWTQFLYLDLRQFKGLETTIHHGPSEISVSTLSLSRAGLPRAFLRAAGISKELLSLWEVETRAVTLPPRCFIWYAQTDHVFAQRLYQDVSQMGMCCWLAESEPHFNLDDDLDDGLASSVQADRRFTFFDIVDECETLFDQIVVLLSEESLQLEQIQYVCRIALEKEEVSGKQVLFPVVLDEAAKQYGALNQMGAKQLNALAVDFTHRQHRESYQRALEHLVHVLRF